MQWLVTLEFYQHFKLLEGYENCPSVTGGLGICTRLFRNMAHYASQAKGIVNILNTKTVTFQEAFLSTKSWYLLLETLD